MKKFGIIVQGLGWAKRHKRDFGAVITIEDPDKRQGLRFHRNPSPDHLLLRFLDLDEPFPEPYCQRAEYRVAEIEHVERALEFSRGQDSLLIHCQVGVSRSSAIALAVLADKLGQGCEQEALQRLLDALLQRDGRLLKIVKDWDDALPGNLQRRFEQREAYLQHYNIRARSTPVHC